jgi:hypothetical protein
MTDDLRRLSERLAARAEDVCATYLSNGRRHGRYWLVGDINNQPGRSLFVRLAGPAYGPGAAGKWTDAATGEHGDLLDLIRLNLQLEGWHDVKTEALRFLALPPPPQRIHTPPARRNSSEAARRLFAASRPASGTLADVYLQTRGLIGCAREAALRFHPSCYLRDDGAPLPRQIPALIAAITDTSHRIVAVQRTYLAPDGAGKAAIDEPRRSLGPVLGSGTRLGTPGPIVMVGEGLETMLTLRLLAPHLPAIAATGSAHLAGLNLSPSLQHCYIACDRDRAGTGAAETLIARHLDSDMSFGLLIPPAADWNLALTGHPFAELQHCLNDQLRPAHRQPVDVATETHGAGAMVFTSAPDRMGHRGR